MDIILNVKEGIYDYQLILLALGVLLFVVLLFLLIFSVVKKRPLKGLFLFFILPIIMIGFPAIQKISFQNLSDELDKAVKVAEKNRTPENKKLLAAKLDEMDKQPHLSESRKNELNKLRREFKLQNPP
jgi:hypothetical protein